MILIIEFNDCDFKMHCKNVDTISYPTLWLLSFIHLL